MLAIENDGDISAGENTVRLRVCRNDGVEHQVELFELVGTIDPTTDIYSTGLILYRIFNGNHGPFEDEKTTPRAADKLRVTGEALPAPMYADYEMAEIIYNALSKGAKAEKKLVEEFRPELQAMAAQKQAK